MKRNFLVMVLCGISLTALLTNCTKDPINNLTNEESRIYITNYDSSAGFNSFKTFSISDSVNVITNGSSAKELNSVDTAYIAAIKKYMQQAGYILVNRNQNPDLAVDVNRIYNTSTGLLSYGDYYNDYGSYYDPGYWGYSGYGYYVPYTYEIYQITEGALSTDILDLKDAKTKGSIDIIWTGLIRGEGIFNASAADGQVQILFAQSTYLKAAN